MQAPDVSEVLSERSFLSLPTPLHVPMKTLQIFENTMTSPLSLSFQASLEHTQFPSIISQETSPSVPRQGVITQLGKPQCLA